jgi:hypothetical protein
MKTALVILSLGLLSSLHAQEALKASLAFHASFDAGLDAEFSRGEKTCVVKKGKELVPAVFNEELAHDAKGGKFGGCLHFPKKGVTRPQFSGVKMLGYSAEGWNATVSTWLRLTPDVDLEPGYCDPVQIVGDDGKKGFIFLEWSKDETPRFFRYAIRPLFHIWNPTNVQWGDIPAEKRPMVQVAGDMDARGLHARKREFEGREASRQPFHQWKAPRPHRRLGPDLRLGPRAGRAGAGSLVCGPNRRSGGL